MRKELPLLHQLPRGRVTADPPDRYVGGDHIMKTHHARVLIIGAGPAGIPLPSALPLPT